jgi:hypothetical protein
MTLDRFSLQRALKNVVVSALAKTRPDAASWDEIAARQVAFTADELAESLGAERTNLLQEFSPETALEWLIYSICMALRPDELPVGFHAKSLLGNVVEPGVEFAGRVVLLEVDHTIWCGPVEVPPSLRQDWTEDPRRTLVGLQKFTAVVERLGFGNDAGHDWGGPTRAVGPGDEIRSPWSWFAAAPPKGGDRQWRAGKSAMELALAWSTKTGIRIPTEVRAILDRNPLTTGFKPLDVLPEHITPLDAFRGESRNHDLIAVGPAGGGHTLLAVEGKAGEPLGPTLLEQLRMGVQKPGSKIPARLSLLSQALFGAPVVDVRTNAISTAGYGNMPNLRYQLLTAACGAVIEAARRGCDQAVLVIHEFKAPGGPGLDAAPSTGSDVQRFIAALGADDRAGIGSLAGPFALHPNEFVSPHVRLLVGMITTPASVKTPIADPPGHG